MVHVQFKIDNMNMKKYKLGDLLSEFHAGKAIQTENVKNKGAYPVYGGNGQRGYTDSYNQDGEYLIIGRQGAYCGNVRYNIGKAYLTEHAIVGQAKENHNPIYIALKLSLMKLSQLQGQSAQPGLSVNTLSCISMEMPPKEIQDKIADIMLKLDRKIELNKQINDNLEAMVKQLYDYWFVQFDFPNEEGKPYKSSGGVMVYNKKMKREIPQGWSNGVLSDVANITMGQSPDGSSYNEDGEGIIFYQGSTDFGLRFPDIRQYTTSPSRYANKGDILMSVRAPVGALNIANNDCCIGRGLSALSSKIGSMTHLYYLMNDFRLKFEGMNSAGTTFGSITKDELFSLPVIIPTKSVISEFEQVCEPIFDKQMIIGEEINALTKQRNELLPLLMNGQATVNYHLSASFLPSLILY